MAETLAGVLVHGALVGLAVVVTFWLALVGYEEYRSPGPLVSWEGARKELAAFLEAVGIVLALLVAIVVLGTVLYLMGIGLWEVVQ